VLWWGLVGILFVLGKRAIRYGFTTDIFMSDFKTDLTIGLSTVVIVGCLLDFKKQKK